MTASNGVKITNLTGTWVMDNNLSTNLDAVLKLQGISWIKRKAISASTATLKITQGSDQVQDDTDSKPTGWMVLEPALAGTLEGTPEKRQLNWTEFEHNDTLFGRVIIRSHYVPGQKIADGRIRPLIEPFTKVITGSDGGSESILTEAVVLPPGITGLDKMEEAFIHDLISSKSYGWTAEQVWAIEIKGDELFLTRRVVVQKGSSTEIAHAFYRPG